MDKTITFLKRLFHIPDWEVQIKNGKMHRLNKTTGQTEYRDCKTKRWLPVEKSKSAEETENWTKPASYDVSDPISMKKAAILLKTEKTHHP